MAVKFYSDVTKKFYDDEKTATAEEEKVKKSQDEKLAKKKAMAEEVEQKRQALEKAKKEYDGALTEFCKKYGAYHYTISAKDFDREIDKTLLSLFNW